MLLVITLFAHKLHFRVCCVKLYSMTFNTFDLLSQEA